MQRLTITAGIVLIALGIVGPLHHGSAQETKPPHHNNALLTKLIDEECTVHLRFDVLGQRFERRGLPALDGAHDTGITITGKLTANDDRWLVIKTDSRQCWIPQDMVLLMESDD
ncbi:MAG: hypothetical protein ACODAQ_12395 [Phycisphaeraceae bacterium]